MSSGDNTYSTSNDYPVSQMPGYPNDCKAPKKVLNRVGRAIMKSYRFHIPKYDLPLLLRPWFLVFTCIIMVTLAFLGFTNFSRALPLNDKLLHFLCFAFATGVFYFIVDVEESARRIWFWHYFGLLFTFLTCFLCGGILSEVVQSLLPYKEFQIGDVVANLLGSALGLLVSFHLEKYYRYRREIFRLYRPLDSDSLSDFEDDLESLGARLLPTRHPVSIDGGGRGKGSSGKPKGRVRFANVWDEREELFEVGEDSEEEPEPEISSVQQREVPKHVQVQPRQAVLST